MNYSGLMISQVGYDLWGPKRAIYRGNLPSKVFFLIYTENGNIVLKDDLKYWGKCWGNNWWIADFSEINNPGKYFISIRTSNDEELDFSSFEIGDYLVWESTVDTVALEQFEKRAELARYRKGWKDCGSDWREVGSHTGALIGLLDLLNIGFEWLGYEKTNRLIKQIIHGCDFLISCQKRAEDLGYPQGSVIHELPNYHLLIPQDHGQFVVTLAKASRYIYEIDRERSLEYLYSAEKTFNFLTRKYKHYRLPNFSYKIHGAPEDYTPPNDFMTGDLLMMMWGAIELAKSGKREYLEDAVKIARKILLRQVKKYDSEGEFYGHFYTYDDHLFTEKAFIHHHVGHDTSLFFNHYMVAFIDLIELLPDHPDRKLWEEAVKDFAYGYFLPACFKNPFYILPVGYFKNYGLSFFAGPWHGFNVCYGYAASQAVRFEIFFGDRNFRNIAVGNLQWILGLNSGLTNESFEGCVMWKERLPEGKAIPYSFICGIGKNSVKTWSQIRGSIGNGLCANRQFQLEIEPSSENDIPRYYSDEDWIPHSGGFLSGLVYLRQVMGWSKFS